MFQTLQCFAHLVMIPSKISDFHHFLAMDSSAEIKKISYGYNCDSFFYLANSQRLPISYTEHTYQPANICDTLVHDTCENFYKIVTLFTIGNSICSMSFAVGNYVTLRLFILDLHFCFAEWNSPFIQICECRSAESYSNIRNEKRARLDVGKRALRPRKRAHIIP